jgi:cytochrome c556
MGLQNMNTNILHTKASLILIAVLLFSVFTGPATVLAHGSAKGVVKERMKSMEVMGQAMKYVSGMMAGKVGLDLDTVDLAARTIVRHGQRIPKLFPKGSDHGPSEARQTIWTDARDFKTHVDRLVDAAEVLSSAAQANDISAVKLAHRAIGKTCSGCHKQFRAKNITIEARPDWMAKMGNKSRSILHRH